MRHLSLFVGMSFFLASCLDLQLFDDMRPIDAGSSAGAEPDLGSEIGSDGDLQQDNENPGGETGTDGDGPPPLDPADKDAPMLVDSSCGALEQNVAGACVASGPVSVSVRLASDEPASLLLQEMDMGRSGILSKPLTTEHHFAVSELVPESAIDVRFILEDINGNGVETEIALTTTSGKPVVVSEVLADPLGPEPAQEFVEIANIGATDLDISGWMIDDGGDANGDLIPADTNLAAGQVALLVSSAYDPFADQDPSPAPDALIIRLASSIGTSGLRNSEAETIELYDAEGILVSRYHGQVGDPIEGNSVIRIAAELPDGDSGAFSLEPAGKATPGQVPRLP